MSSRSVLVSCALVGLLAFATACGSSAAPASTPAHPGAATTSTAPSSSATTTTAPTPSVTLSFASQDPGPHTALDKSFAYFAQQVGKQTNGKVKVKVYWGGSLLNGGEVLQGVQNDTADFAQLITPYFPGQLPLWSVEDAVPFNGLTPQTALTVGRGMLTQVPQLLQEAAKFNQVILSLSITPSYGLWSKTPVTGLGALNGMKVRTNGTWIPKVFSAVGAKPVSLKGPDIYTALQRGTISGVYFPIAYGELFKLNEVASHFINVNFGAGALSGEITVNKTAWQKKLTAQERKTITQVGHETEDYLVSQLKVEQQSQLATLKQQHVQYSSFPNSALHKWASLPAVTSLRNQWVQSVNAKGLPGTNTMNTFLKLAGLH